MPFLNICLPNCPFQDCKEILQIQRYYAISACHFAHTIIAFKSIEKGLDKLVVNDEKIYEDLENNWAVVAEAIQTVLRRENYPQPYEALKDLTRGNNKMIKKTIHQFIDAIKGQQ